MTNELQIGSVGISIVLTILLRMIYGTFNVPKKYKPWIAVIIGVVLSLIAFYTTGSAPTFAALVTYMVQGFMVGATAVGLYEMTKN